MRGRHPRAGAASQNVRVEESSRVLYHRKHKGPEVEAEPDLGMSLPILPGRETCSASVSRLGCLQGELSSKHGAGDFCREIKAIPFSKSAVF